MIDALSPPRATCRTRAHLTTYLSRAQAFLCAGCHRLIQARFCNGRCLTRFVLANVYDRGRWAKTEAWHEGCYAESGEPFGATLTFRKPTTIGDAIRGSRY